MRRNTAQTHAAKDERTTLLDLGLIDGGEPALAGSDFSART